MESIHEAIHEVAADYDINLGKLGQPIRVAVTSAENPLADLRFVISVFRCQATPKKMRGQGLQSVDVGLSPGFSSLRRSLKGGRK